jgi:hypothetical protein
MKKTSSAILTAAVAGLLMGSTATLSGCKSNDAAMSQASIEKHACKNLNSCTGKGGCKTGDQGCAGKNSCSGKGGCATAAHHDCAGKNSCKHQGGCRSSGNCAGKNDCTGKGGCAVPVKQH